MAYRGIAARLPIGFQGFTGTQNPSQAGPGHFVFVEGAELDGGIIRKDGGAALYNAANPVHGGLLDSSTKILLHFNGLDGSIAFPDTNGVTSRVWTRVATGQTDTAQSKFGGSSLLLASGDYITTPDDAPTEPGTSDFTVDFWFNCNLAHDGVNHRGLFGKAIGFGSPSDRGYFAYRNSTTDALNVEVSNGSVNVVIASTTTFTNVVNPGFHHFALVRVGNILKLFIDGVQEGGDQAFTGSVNNVASVFAVGSVGAGLISTWVGWIDEFRLSIGIARWTANFTPPTAAYADYTTEPSRAIVLDLNAKSLLHLDGADASTNFPDSSVFPKTWTASGNAQVDTAQFVFSGASLLCDGTGDFISAPDNADFTLGSSDFTIDCWVRPNVNGTDVFVAGQLDVAGIANANSAWYLLRTSANKMQFAVIQATTGIGPNSTTNIVSGAWYHIAAVRVGGVLRLFINGVQEGGDINITGSVNDSTAVVGIGRAGNFTTLEWNGWVDEFRFVTGIAKWTVPFQPPTVPYIVAGSNNQLLQFGSLPTNVQQVVAGIHWPAVAGAGTQLNVIATDDGLILGSTAGAFTGLMKSGLNALGVEPPPYFMFAGGEAVGSNRKLMMFSGNNQAQIAIGGTLVPTFANISGPPADWSSSFPTFGVLHAFRVFAGGNASDPHRIYYSTTTNHQDFAGGGSGTIAIFPGEGEKIIGGLSFRGALIIWKYPQGVYVVITTDPTPANWRVDRLTKAIGGLNQLSIVQIENDIAFLDKSGNTHLLSATNEFGDVNTSNLSNVSQMGPFMRSDVQLANAQKFIGLWYPAKRQLWQAVCQLGSVNNDLRLQTGFEGILQPTEGQGAQGGAPPRVFMSRRDTILSLWLHPDPLNGLPKPMVGDDLGFVWYMDQEARNKNNVAYPIQFQTASTDMAFVDPALATKQKNGEFLELAYEPRGDWDLTVDVFWDDVYIQTIFFNMGGSGGTLGSFILDTDVLGTEGARSQRQRIEGSGRRLKIAAQNEGLNQDVSLAEFHLSFSVGDERVFE